MSSDLAKARIKLTHELWTELENLRFAIAEMEATHYGPDDEEQLDYEVTLKLKQAISNIDRAQWKYKRRTRLNQCLLVLLEATDQNTKIYEMLKRHDEIYKHHVHFTEVVDILARLGRMLRDTKKKYYAFRYPKDGTSADGTSEKPSKLQKSDFKHDDLTSSSEAYATSAAGLTALLGRLRLWTC